MLVQGRGTNAARCGRHRMGVLGRSAGSAQQWPKGQVGCMAKMQGSGVMILCQGSVVAMEQRCGGSVKEESVTGCQVEQAGLVQGYMVAQLQRTSADV